MRHHKANRRFGRPKKQREALVRGLARSLILRGRIQTTTAKAKELRPYVERLVTAAKADTLAARRLVQSRLQSPTALRHLFATVAPKYAERAGGYTRIMKLGKRGLDARDMAIIEFV